MPQTKYKRPWPRWVALAVAVPVTILLIAVTVTQGATSPAPWILLLIEAIALAVLAIFDPEVTIESHRTNPDGSQVKIRRPIVGFKKNERQIGVTGGYEVRVDGFRYEPAYLRI